MRLLFCTSSSPVDFAYADACVRLLQIPFSHSCIKVRRALELKGLDCELQSISPMDRKAVIQASGQGLVPVLIDRSRVIADSTAILLYLEETYPRSPLLPADASLRAECLLLEDWADATFLALTRRLAYWHALSTPGAVEGLFFPDSRGLSLWIKGRIAQRAIRRRFGLSEGRNRRDEVEVRRVARLAVDRLAGLPYLVGEAVTIADITLAALSSPLLASSPEVRGHEAIRLLLEWSRGILGERLLSIYASPMT